MGSSSNGTYPDPPPAPMPSGTVPYGQSAPYSPRFINFLPTDNSMATGLTPAMVAQTNAPVAPPPVASGPPPQVVAAQQAAQVQKQRQDLAQQMALLQSQNRQGYQGMATGNYISPSWGGGRSGGHGGGGYS